MRVMNKLQDNGFYCVALVGQDVNGGAAASEGATHDQSAA